MTYTRTTGYSESQERTAEQRDKALELGLAWQEAEAADYDRPSRVAGDGVHLHADAPGYCACVRGLRDERLAIVFEARGATPAAALRALASRLRQS